MTLNNGPKELKAGIHCDVCAISARFSAILCNMWCKAKLAFSY